MQSLASPSTSYAAPTVISLGEEYTDASLPSSSTPSHSFESEHNPGYDEEFYYSSPSDSETDDDSDDSDYSPISPGDEGNSASARQHNRSSIVPALWHAEHARLLSLQTAVLDNERAAWTREKRLESEVARIKVDLARLQQRQQSISNSQNVSLSSLNSVRTSAPTEASPVTSPNPHSSSTPPRCAGPRGPRPKPQQLRSSAQTRTTTGVTSESAPPPLLPKFSFESLKEQSAQQPKPEPEQTAAVTVLSHHLIQARSQRAQERQRRRNEHERMRELATLLTLGSEVRKWEERLAWSQIHSTTRAAASDDSHLNTESVAKAANNNNDTDVDPRGKRLSRSSSLPSNRMSYVPPPSSQQQQPPNSRPAPLSPALPSLALSPLWRVSAEMILRRRQLSERPRRTPPVPLVASQTPVSKVLITTTLAPVQAPTVPSLATTVQTQAANGTTLARPAHALRGPRDKRTVSSTTTSSPISAPSSTGTATPTLATSTIGTSSGSGSLSVKRNSIPPPISIPPSAPFCSTTAVTSANNENATSRLGAPTGTCTFLFSKTTPVRPSALKWAFTADDLAREMQEEETRRKELVAATITLTNSSVPTQTCYAESSSESSEGDSGSDSSGKSSSDCGGSSSSGQECAPVTAGGGVERRGRARFSWRKSIPKDGSAGTNADIPPTPPIASVNVET